MPANTVQRKDLSLLLSISNVLIGLRLAAHNAWQADTLPDFNRSMPVELVILMLLSAGQNLRLYYLAKILEAITPAKHLCSER